MAVSASGWAGAQSDRALRARLREMDHRGYPAYKQLRGSYDLGLCVLSIDHVQGDPFAAPSQVSALIAFKDTELPAELAQGAYRRRALEDFLLRRFSQACGRYSGRTGGSGKSGRIATTRPGPEVLVRSACEIGRTGVTVRFQVGLPARGRTIDARAAERLLLDFIPRCVREALVADDAVRVEARAAVELADDQEVVRRELARRDLVAFVADGAVLPRESGVSARPMADALPFTSPESLRVTLELPHRGAVCGMGIRRGVTLIVGGGYHGKSTLLAAVQEGVYDHVAGDGRELVITEDTAVKLRAEDGRAVQRVDISLFINDLPNGRDTQRFSTEDASGSTSQAASTIEACEAGARTLLIDEDTSATNFMVRDALMEAVVSRDHEPITPFVERVRGLWADAGVSCVLVAGSSGAFFAVADTVIQMDCYRAHDITARVREVCAARGVPMRLDAPEPCLLPRGGRHLMAHVAPGRAGRQGLRVRAGWDGFSVEDADADLRQVEQLVDAEQVEALAQLTRIALEEGLLDGRRALTQVVAELLRRLDERGWSCLGAHGRAACGCAMPRAQELFAALNRLRA